MVLIAHLALISHTPWVGASGATQKPANSGLAGPQQHHADIPGDTTGSRHEEPATPASDPGLGISQVRCVPAGTVRLSTKLTCRWRPVDVVLQVRTGCPSDQATPLGIRSLRITNPLPDAIIPYPTEQGPGAPEGLVPEWVFNAAPAEGITVSHRIQATEVGEFLIGAQGEIVVEDDSGRRITGSLQPETLIVVPACSGPRAATAYFPWLHKPSCKPSRVPADVIVLLDRSGSTGERSIEQAAQQLPVFFEGLVPDRDRLGVIAFDEDAELLVPLGHARADTESTLRGLDLKPGTRLERAIAAGRAELSGPRGRPAARRLMLLVTDGVQTGSAGEQVALAAAESARLRGITLLAMALGPSPDRMLLTRLTGSPRRVVAAPSPSSIGSAYVELADLASCSSAGP